jgi:hypothetical protein
MPFATFVAFLSVLVLKYVINRTLITYMISTLGSNLSINQGLFMAKSFYLIKQFASY